MTDFHMTRRTALLGLTAMGALTACGASPRGRSVASASSSSASAMPIQQNAGFDDWVVSFKNQAEGRGISRSVLDTAFRGAGYIPGVIERDRNQTEFTRTLEDYLAIAASDERVSNGRANYRSFASTLNSVESTYGVEGKVVAAVWGMESSYGTRRGDTPIVSAMATLSYAGRRQEFFTQQLYAVLKILANGDTTPNRMVGSWAGAMGHTQFMPTSYLSYAVDHTGDGRRDIWSDDPTDALASTANFLRAKGWKPGRGYAPGQPNFRVIEQWNAASVYQQSIALMAARIDGN